MHETHLIQPIIKGISEHAQKEGAKSVSRIRLKVGALTGIKEDSFKETFAVLAKGTMNDILNRVSLWNNIPKEDLINRLR